MISSFVPTGIVISHDATSSPTFVGHHRMVRQQDVEDTPASTSTTSTTTTTTTTGSSSSTWDPAKDFDVEEQAEEGIDPKRKVCVITGSSQGLGQAMAYEIARSTSGNHIVVVNYFPGCDESAYSTLQQIKDLGGDGIAIPADCTKPDQISKMFQQVIDKYGKVDGKFFFKLLEVAVLKHIFSKKRRHDVAVDDGGDSLGFVSMGQVFFGGSVHMCVCGRRSYSECLVHLNLTPLPVLFSFVLSYIPPYPFTSRPHTHTSPYTHTQTVLINNAGITKDNLVARMKPKDFQAVIDVNLSGAFYVTQGFLKHAINNPTGSARIINIASVVGQIGNPGQANYAASKGGIIGTLI